MQRGKNDTIDSIRIAEYARSGGRFRFRDKMQLWKPQRPILQKLAALSVLRQRLILIRQQLQQPINEQECFIDPRLQKQLVKSCQSSLKSIEADLKNTNKLIDDLIQTDEQLKKLFSLVTSVPGIGPVTATELIIATEEFNTINSPKKLAASAVRLSCRSSPL